MKINYDDISTKRILQTTKRIFTNHEKNSKTKMAFPKEMDFLTGEVEKFVCQRCKMECEELVRLRIEGKHSEVCYGCAEFLKPNPLTKRNLRKISARDEEQDEDEKSTGSRNSKSSRGSSKEKWYCVSKICRTKTRKSIRSFTSLENWRIHMESTHLNNAEISDAEDAYEKYIAREDVKEILEEQGLLKPKLNLSIETMNIEI